jgi:hypothetical protein
MDKQPNILAHAQDMCQLQPASGLVSSVCIVAAYLGNATGTGSLFVTAAAAAAVIVLRLQLIW